MHTNSLSRTFPAASGPEQLMTPWSCSRGKYAPQKSAELTDSHSNWLSTCSCQHCQQHHDDEQPAKVKALLANRKVMPSKLTICNCIIFITIMCNKMLCKIGQGSWGTPEVTSLSSKYDGQHKVLHNVWQRNDLLLMQPSARVLPIIVHGKVKVMDCWSSVTHLKTRKKVTLRSLKLMQTKLHLWPHPSITPPQFLGASYATCLLDFLPVFFFALALSGAHQGVLQLKGILEQTIVPVAPSGYMLLKWVIILFLNHL